MWQMVENAPSRARVCAALALPLIVVGSAALVAPAVRLPEAAVPFVTFALAAAVSIAAVAAGAREPSSPRVSLGVAAGAALVLGALALAPRFSMLGVVVVATCLPALGWSIGGAIGRRVEHPSHLLPAAFVAAAMDVASVVSPAGPTHQIVRSERALSLLAVAFPVFGTRDAAPALGVGDLVFVGVVLGVAGAHRLPYARLALACFAGTLASAGLSALLETEVPALPAIGALVLASSRAARTLRPREVPTAVGAMALAAMVALGAVASKLGWLPGSAPDVEAPASVVAPAGSAPAMGAASGGR